jgi:hypothetical protein
MTNPKPTRSPPRWLRVVRHEAGKCGACGHEEHQHRFGRCWAGHDSRRSDSRGCDCHGFDAPPKGAAEAGQ